MFWKHWFRIIDTQTHILYVCPGSLLQSGILAGVTVKNKSLKTTVVKNEYISLYILISV